MLCSSVWCYRSVITCPYLLHDLDGVTGSFAVLALEKAQPADFRYAAWRGGITIRECSYYPYDNTMSPKMAICLNCHLESDAVSYHRSSQCSCCSDSQARLLRRTLGDIMMVTSLRCWKHCWINWVNQLGYNGLGEYYSDFHLRYFRLC
jgi:hypothetical protein